jgi:cell wall-associated NlpC family hydrolase
MRFITLTALLLFLSGCGSSKKGKSGLSERTVSVAAAHKERTGDDSIKEESASELPTLSEVPIANKTKADHIINTALTFSGVSYKYGGTTKKGMDCSGLLYVSFGEHDVRLPRTSIHMAEEGKKIKLNKVAKGDLLFFRTSRRAKRINHVGMVVEVTPNEIKFIHASTSRGVIVSSLRDGFWNSAFVKATRIL